MNATKERVVSIKVGFHYGNVIKYLAQHYNTGFDVVREIMQNSLDEGAKNIYIIIDCVKSSINAFDDGNGAALADIQAKFNRIGESLKIGQPGKSGSRGIGNLAGLCIADMWQLITRDVVKRGSLHAYSFNRSELEKRDDVRVHAEELDFKNPTGAPFPATTLLKLTSVDRTALRQLSDKETIETTLQEAFSPILRTRNVQIRIAYRNFKGETADFKIVASKFRGMAMEEIDVETKYGPITFAFHHSPTPLDKPTILVEHRGVYALPLSNFFMLRILPRELETIFAKGYFEGEIRLGFCEINGQRSAFKNSPELEVFVNEVESFAKDTLEPLVTNLEASGREEKLKRVLDKVVSEMQKYLRMNPNLLPPSLRALDFKAGDPVPGGDGDEAIQSNTSGTPDGKKPPTPGPKEPTEEPGTPPKPRTPGTPDPDPEPEEDIPVKDLKPDALKKQRAKSQKVKKDGERPKTQRPPVRASVGRLQVVLVPPKADESFAWHSRFVDPGYIQVNILNEKFSDAERRGETVLRKYVRLLVHKELTCASLAPHDSQVFSNGFERTFLSYWKSSLGD